MQLVVPIALAYVPDGHTSQVEIVDAPITVEYFPIGHEVQCPVPMLLAYFPASQARQGYVSVVFASPMFIPAI